VTLGRSLTIGRISCSEVAAQPHLAHGMLVL